MDRIAQSLDNKRIVFWEEVARDGAQAKTILSGKQRIEIAKAHGQVFNEHGPDHLVFAAGFYSIGKEEVDVIKELADGVDNCYLAVNCRSSKTEISESIDSLQKAKYGRVAFVSPFSERLCNIMLHKNLEQTKEATLSMAKFALDKAAGMPVDVQLAAAFDGNPALLGELASELHALGIATVGMGDTQGKIYPYETAEFLRVVKQNSDPNVRYSVHFHNDLCFALANNLEAIRQGIYLPSTSWLGIAERNGLLRTEVLTLLLAHEPKMLKKRLGIDGERLFLSPPNLKLLPEIALKISQLTGIPLKVTDPIVGTGMNTISTGTPFVDTRSFQPFDPLEVLGIPKKVYVTQLASARVIKEVSSEMGFQLSDNQIAEVMKMVKEKAYRIERSIFPENELREIFTQIVNI